MLSRWGFGGSLLPSLHFDTSIHGSSVAYNRDIYIKDGGCILPVILSGIYPTVCRLAPTLSVSVRAHFSRKRTLGYILACLLGTELISGRLVAGAERLLDTMTMGKLWFVLV